MLWEHEPQVSASTDLLSPPNCYECFYSSLETQRTCFIFLLENTVEKKEKQLVNFEYQHVNSPIIASMAHASSVFLSSYGNPNFNQSAHLVS